MIFQREVVSFFFSIVVFIYRLYLGLGYRILIELYNFAAKLHFFLRICKNNVTFARILLIEGRI